MSLVSCLLSVTQHLDGVFLFRKCKRNSGYRCFIVVFLKFWADHYILVCTLCYELMNSMGSHGSLSLLSMMKVMV
jgi:hypothetical protein